MNEKGISPVIQMRFFRPGSPPRMRARLLSAFKANTARWSLAYAVCAPSKACSDACATAMALDPPLPRPESPEPPLAGGVLASRLDTALEALGSADTLVAARPALANS